MKSMRSRFRCAAGQKFIFALIVLTILTSSASAGPDLIIDRARVTRTLLIQNRTFRSYDCAVIEGCMPYTGTRKLLRFTLGFINIGNRDLILGDPGDRPELYTYSPCQGHYHLKGVANYALYNSAGTRVAISRKQTFCLLDLVKYSSTAGPSHGYQCNYQGITAGWEDVYYRNLDCQWLDITGVRRGNYTLKLTVNPGRVFAESNYANNTVSVPVTIP